MSTTTYWVLKHRETGELKRLGNGRQTATPHLYRTEGHARGAASNSCSWSGGKRLSTNWEPVKATLTIENA